MTHLVPGDFAPMFISPSSINPEFRLETAGGRRIVLSFLGSLKLDGPNQVLASLVAKRDWFAAHRTFVFPISADRTDAEQNSAQALAGIYTVFWDFGLEIARLYGIARASNDGTGIQLDLGSVLLDENQRFVAFVPVGDPNRHADELAAVIGRLPNFGPPREVTHQAPVLIIPQILTANQCRFLIDAFETHGGVDSGYMTNRDGRTVGVIDYYHKRRSDWFIREESLQTELRRAVVARVAPEIRKAFQFTVTRMERFLIGRYDAATSDHFRPHRDDNTAGTAHRRFAMTLNLNTEEYEGGDLRFPEYSLDTYRPPTGAAAIFSCTLMHEALPVTRGRRYAFLPFLFDEAAAESFERYRSSYADKSTLEASSSVFNPC